VPNTRPDVLVRASIRSKRPPRTLPTTSPRRDFGGGVENTAFQKARYGHAPHDWRTPRFNLKQWLRLARAGMERLGTPSDG
jgi:hypothetical protein